MDETKRTQIANAFASLPDVCKCRVATASELNTFESKFGPIPFDFRWFLMHCGGGTVGSEWVDGIDELAGTQQKFKAESDINNGWTMDGVL
jgi:hypothetical protein